MQLDRSILIGARVQILQRLPTDRAHPAFLSCTDSADKSAISRLVAGQIKRALTDQEIADAILFHQSGPGRKYTERDLQMLDAAFSRKTPPTYHFSVEELSAIARFSKSPADRS